MNIQHINAAIASVCHEIEITREQNLNWSEMDEVDYVREAAICICSSQIRFEVAAAAGERIAAMETLKKTNF
ncbi:MAG: hypothetical protein ACIAQZ_02070 [Sedimentisphaeraceae bacterium JB056]